MTNKDMKSAMLSQIRNAVSDLDAIARTTTLDYLSDCVPADELLKVNNVLLTGCGDSYCAAMASVPLYENMEAFKGTGMVPGTPTRAIRNIECSRYYNTYGGWDPMRIPGHLVGAVSVSGAPARPTEAVLRINKVGGNSVAFTDNLQSPLACAAKHAVKLNVPPCEVPSPGVTSYLASTYAVMMFGLYMSVAKKQISSELALRQRTAALQFVNAFAGAVQQEVEEHAFEIASRWEKEGGIEVMDFVSDGPDYATSFFGSAKMVESFGGITTHDDSEDWCHINFFIRKPRNVATFVVANTTSPSFGRMLEAIRAMSAIGRPLVIVSDAAADVFPAGADVFTLPKPAVAWANPLMQHLPMDYIAAFIGGLRGCAPYRIGAPSHRDAAESSRFRSSKIEIV